MPWINNTNLDQCLDILKNTSAQVVFGHFEIKGFEMYRGMPAHEGLEISLFNKFELVCSGHFHKKSTMGNISYLGCPYQMTWNDYDDPKGFHIYDTVTRELEFIQNEMILFHKVWYNDDGKTVEELTNYDYSYLENCFVKVIVKNKTQPDVFDIWMNKLQEYKPLEISVVEIS